MMTRNELWADYKRRARRVSLGDLAPGNPATSIPYLRKEVLQGAYTILDEQSSMYPLFSLFPREQYVGEKLEIKVKTLTPTVGEFVAPDGAANMVRPGTLKSIFVDPVYKRDMDQLKNSDFALFAAWDEVVQRGAMADNSTLQGRVQRRVAELISDLTVDMRETFHDMFAQTLQGSFAYIVDGIETTVSFGLNDLSAAAGSPDWSNAADKLIEQFALMLDAFIDNSNGRAATHVVYNPKAWAEYFVTNTQFQNFVQAVPGLAQAFAGKPVQGMEFVNPDGSFVDPMWGLTWIPVRGPHVDRNGNSVQRWDKKKLTLISMDGPESVLEHAMVQDQYNPEAALDFDVFDQDEPKGTFVRAADNGAAAILIPERVQTCTIAS